MSQPRPTAEISAALRLNAEAAASGACAPRAIACIGAGYIGGPTMAVIAQQCPEIEVWVVDRDSAKIAAWNSEELPVYEPGLEEIVRACRGRNLFFSTDMAAAIRRCSLIFVGVNTPTKTFGEGAGYASDLQFWEAAARTIAAEADGDKIVVEKSTLPVRTADAMAAVLHTHPEHNFTVLSNPEFLAEGTAIEDLLHPDRVLIGGPETPAGREAVAKLSAIYAAWVPREKILATNVWSSELSKLAANAMLAQRLSSINAFSALCEVTGADVEEVAHVLGMDRRIGPHFLRAGPGFGGSCFKKDVLSLVYLCRSYGLETCADYWEGVIAMNDFQQRRIVERTVHALFNTLSGKRLALFGFAFKAHTGDTREAPAIAIARRLLAERAKLVITDPRALANARRDLAGEPGVAFASSPYEAAEGADAILLLTEWPEYRGLDWARIYRAMRKPALLFDARNLLDHAALRALGFRVLAVGKPAGEP